MYIYIYISIVSLDPYTGDVCVYISTNDGAITHRLPTTKGGPFAVHRNNGALLQVMPGMPL